MSGITSFDRRQKQHFLQSLGPGQPKKVSGQGKRAFEKVVELVSVIADPHQLFGDDKHYLLQAFSRVLNAYILNVGKVRIGSLSSATSLLLHTQ